MNTFRTLTASALLLVFSWSTTLACGGDKDCCKKGASAKKCCSTEKSMAKKEAKSTPKSVSSKEVATKETSGSEVKK